MEAILGIIVEFAQKYPFFASFVFVVGILRVINKPLFAAFRAYVSYTPSPKDDVVLDKVEASPIYKGVSFVLDWFASVKVK